MRVPVLRATIFLTLAAASVTACSGGSKTAAAPAAASAAASAQAAAASASTSPAASSSSSGGGSGQDLNACGLLAGARASALAGEHYSAAKPQLIAPGQDQCTYANADGGSDLVVIIYQPGSGVTWQMMNSVLSGTGNVKSVSGVGDRAMVGGIELDAQAGSRLVAVQGAGGTLTGDYSGAAAIAKAVIAALH